MQPTRERKSRDDQTSLPLSITFAVSSSEVGEHGTTMTTTFYYTVTRNEIRPTMPAVPVLVSAAGWTVASPQKRNMYLLRPPPLPTHVVERGADCGGFVATTRWKGRYRFRPRDYVTWLMKWRPQWAAIMDLCCVDLGEDGRLVYPGKEEVLRRQQFTTEMATEFWALYQHVPLTWVVTIQGWYSEEYVRHARVLAPLIQEMAETYFDGSFADEEDGESDFRVGIGSLCGRDPRLVHEIIGAVRAVIGRLPLHLWGTKLAFLRYPLDPGAITSLDSAAWNGLWGSEHDARRESGLSEADYCWKVAYPAYAQRVSTALQHPQFTPLIETTLTIEKAPAAPLPGGLYYRRTGEGAGEQRMLPLL